ncbi:MAG: hypothetical protein AAFP02_02130 [Bacteroidota bacterium]
MQLLHLPKRIFSLLLLITFCLPFSGTFGQEVAEGQREFMKKSTANGLTIVVEGEPKNVSKVMDELINRGTGVKGKNTKGFRLHPNARFAEISNATMDVYYDVERASKTTPPQTRVTLFLSSGNDNFMESGTHPDEMSNATEFLENLQYEVTKYEMALAIEAQEKLIEKEVKNHEKMVNDSISLQQKLAETIESIENNKVARANQLVKIEEERQRLINTQQTLARIEQYGLEALEEDSIETMEQQMENVSRQPTEETVPVKDEGEDDGGK